MARVEIPAPGDLIMDEAGNVREGDAVTLTLAGTVTAATHYSALTGGTSATGGLVTASDGTIVDGSGVRRYVNTGQYDLTISAITHRIQATVATDVFHVDAPAGVAATDRAAIQAGVDAITALGGGVVQLQRGDYVINTSLDWPVGVAVKMRGAGNGGSGNVYGTRLKRTSGTDEIITALGTGDTAATRTYLDLEDMELQGGTLGGVNLRVERASHLNLRNVRIANSTVEGAIFKQVWDSKTYNVIVEVCGNGTTNAACLISAVAGVGGQGGCDTFYWHGAIFQGNTGTDVKLDGSTADTAPSNDVEFFGAKLESGSGTFPYIDFEYAKACAFHGGRISMPTGRSGLMVKQNGTHTDFRPNRIVGMALDFAGTTPVPDYFIDHGVGSLHLVGVNFPATAPTLGHVRVRSTVNAGRHKIRGVMRAQTGVPLVVDERATPEFIGKERVRMQRQSGTAAAGLLGTSAVWDFDAAVAEDFYGNVTVPPDAIPGSTAVFRFMWTAAAITGDVIWRVTSQGGFSSGEAVGGAGTNYDVTSTAPSVTNSLVTATTSTGPTVNPGDVLQVYASRNATVGGDTMTGDARLLTLEAVVDVDP